MRYENNDRLREYLDRGAAGAYREHLRHPRFEFHEEAFAAALDQVCAQFPELAPEDAQARAAFRLLTSGVAPEVAVPLPSRWYRVRTFVRDKSVQSWPWLKLAWAVAVLLACAASVLMLSALVARAEPTPQHMRAYRNAMRGMSLLAASPAGAAQQPSGIILQFQQNGSALATRPAGLVVLNCSTGMSCSFSGTTFTLTSTGTGGSGCTPPGTSSRLLYDDGAGGCADTGLSWSGSTATAPSGVTFTYSGSGIINARNWAGTSITNAESLGKIPIGNGDGTATWSDPFVSGITAHDAVGTSTNPVLMGGYASAAAPADVSTDGDATRLWVLRNGSAVVNLAAGGSLIPGDATNGLKVQVTTAPTTTVTATNLSSNVAQMNGVAVTMGNGVAGTGVQRVTIASDNSSAAGIGASGTGSAVPSAAHYAAGNGTGNLTGYLNCDNTAVYDASTSGSTQLVALTSGQTIYICGYQISQSTTTSVSVNLRYGTGTSCATGATNITPSYPLQSATATGPIGMVVMTPGFTGLKTAAGNALCINTSAAVSVQALVWYTKF